jgi:gamma-glutamyltranspeptidase/glutathione hydrolase
MRAAIASPHRSASEIGRDVLAAGGTAADAALAANGMLWACYPHMCGIGGDLFLLYYESATGTVYCLNGTGRAPALATPEAFRKRGFSHVPARGPLSVTVPGALDAWEMAWRRFGTAPLADLLGPAAEAATNGVPVTRRLARWISSSADDLRSDPTLADAFLPGGQPLVESDVLTQPKLGAALRRLAEAGLQDLYTGDLASALAHGCEDRGGLLRASDLAEHKSEWVEPLRVEFDGVEVYTTPPPSQGLAGLQILNLLSFLEGGRGQPGSAQQLDAFVRARRAAFHDRDRYVSDPDYVDIPIKRLLSLDYAHDVAKAPPAAPLPAAPLGGDTVYICALDGNGDACSLIQSIYYAFGSAFTPGETGIVMHNRAHYFSLTDDHPNIMQPGKRTLHTLMASMALRQGKPWLVFGTMGADGQPQTTVQVLLRALAGAGAAEAVAAPRVLSGRFFLEDRDDQLAAEEDFGEEVLAELEAQGHDVRVVPAHDETMGHAHAIVVNGETVDAGADPRSDGAAFVLTNSSAAA